MTRCAVVASRHLAPCTVAYHVVEIFVVRFLERSHRKTDLVDPLLPTTLKPEDSVAVFYASSLTPAPELCLRRVYLPTRTREIDTSSFTSFSSRRRSSQLPQRCVDRSHAIFRPGWHLQLRKTADPSSSPPVPSPAVVTWLLSKGSRANSGGTNPDELCPACLLDPGDVQWALRKKLVP